MPVILGSLARIPLGLLADRFGGRLVFGLLLFFLAAPLVLAGLTGSFPMLLLAAFFLGRSDRDRSVLLLVATFVVTPYALTYDLGLLTGALALLANSRFGQSNRTGLLIALAMLLPVIMMPLGEAHVTIAPLLIMIMFVMALANTGAWERLRGNQASYAGTGQGHAPQRQVDPAAAFEQR